MSAPAYVHRLQWPIDLLPLGKSVLLAHPELTGYPVLVEHGAGFGDGLLRFAIFFADRGTGLQGIGDLDRRKREALRLAGVDEDDPRHAEVLTWRSRPAVLLVNQVIRLQNDLDYAVWFHTMLGLYDSAEQISARIDAAGDLAAQVQEGAPALAVAGGMDEDKRMRTYTLRHALIDKVNGQRVAFKALTAELFSSDEELAAASQREKLKDAGAVGRRAQEETFIPRKK